MQNFKDSEGRTWGIHITRGLLREIKRDTGLLLTSIWEDDMKGVTMLAEDVVLTSDLIWLCVREQAESRRITQEEFEEATDGDHFLEAFYALLQAVVDFFPKAQRTLLTKALGEMRAMEKKMSEKMLEVSNSLTSLSSATDSQESSESTQTGEASES